MATHRAMQVTRPIPTEFKRDGRRPDVRARILLVKTFQTVSLPAVSPSGATVFTPMILDQLADGGCTAHLHVDQRRSMKRHASGIENAAAGRADLQPVVHHRQAADQAVRQRRPW